MMWEYKLCPRADLDRGHIHELNELGKEGWEAFYISDTSIYLKRPLKEERVEELDNKITEQSYNHCNPSCHYWGYQCNINEMFRNCYKKNLDIENLSNKKINNK